MGQNQGTIGRGKIEEKLKILWDMATEDERRLIIIVTSKLLHSRNMRKVLELIAQSKNVVTYN